MCKSSSATEGRADEILDLNLVLREVLWMQCDAGEAHRDFQDDVSEFESGLRHETGNACETCNAPTYFTGTGQFFTCESEPA